MLRSSLLVLMRKVFTLPFHCVIKYLMAKHHCLSPPPSLALFIGLCYELVLPFAYSNEDEESL